MMKEQSFEQILDHCLQDIARTGDVEAALRRYPQQAARLRPLLMTAVSAGRHYASVPEPPAGLAEGRKRLLATAVQQRSRVQTLAAPILKRERKPKMKLAFAFRLISAVLAAVIGTSAVGGGVAMAANGSLPGDTLYPAKLAIEDFRLNLASTVQEQVRLDLQFADERLAEIEGLAQRGQAIPEQVTARMEQHLYQAMNQVAWASEGEIPGLLERITQRTQTQMQVLDQLRTRVREQDRTRLENARQVCQRVREDAAAGLADPQTFRLRYQQRDGVPDDVTPPEPPANTPQGPEASPGAQNGSQGSGGQEQGEQQEQEQNREQNQNQQPEQDPGQQQEQQQNQEQNQQEPGQQQEQQQNQEQNQQQNQQQEQQQNQQQNQQQDQEQQQNQQQDQEGPGGPNSPTVTPSPNEGEDSGGAQNRSGQP